MGILPLFLHRYRYRRRYRLRVNLNGPLKEQYIIHNMQCTSEV